MNRRFISVLSASAVIGTGLAFTTGTAAQAVAPIDQPPHAANKGNHPTKQDNKPDTRFSKRNAVRQAAVDQLVKGEAKLKGQGRSQRIEMADGTLVSYPTSQTAQLLTFLVEFGENNTNEGFPGQTGPVHNTIPEPGFSDNSTYWEENFSPEHYKEMFFTGLEDQNGESFAGAYDEMSSGRFKLQGDVSDWVRLDKSEASYQGDGLDHDGDGEPDTVLGDETADGMTNYIQDTANAWYDAQIASGQTPAQVEAYLKSFDVWDRYDLDGDGIENEPDGYIDHFQAIHAGTGEEDGSEPWAIWSHRWAANQNARTGPTPGQCDACFPVGGIKIGDSNLWIRDYTTEPENGGLGVFAHEFGHDLGLPDFYDTVGGENSTAFWTLMSSGSWMSHGNGSIGTTPNHMGPAEKLFLGWYGPGNRDLAVVDNSAITQVDLGPSYHATSGRKQAAAVLLPQGKAFVETGDAASGDGYLYSGTGDDRSATATTDAFEAPAGAQLTAKVRYDLEKDYDFTFVEASTDGSTWDTLKTNLSSTASTANNGIDGTSDADCDDNCVDHNPEQWVDLTADLSAYAGKPVQVRFRTTNDGGLHYFGFAADDVSVGSAFSDDFEDGTDEWDLDLYSVITGGGYDVAYDQYYLLENRQYRGYDTTLKQGPYNFGFAESAPDRVQHFPYQDGLLVWYHNGFYGDNNTSQHPGYGQSLPVDANGAKSMTWPNGAPVRNRIQAFDATFDVDRKDGIQLQQELGEGRKQTLTIPSAPSTSVFDDSNVNAYWSSANPTGSTKVGGTGTVIKVLSSDEQAGRMQIEVGTKLKASKAPAIKGTAMVGRTLSATPATWMTDGDLTRTYRWNVGGKAVPGATGTTYKVRPTDAGKTVTVTETASTPGQYAGSATSAPTAKVAKASTRTYGTAYNTEVGTRPTLKVAVNATGATVTGYVKITYAGRTITTKKALQSGRTSVTLPAYSKGTRWAKVTYLGSTGFAASSKTVEVTMR